jgi:hypothetical protein
MTTIYGYVVDVSGETFTVYGPDEIPQMSEHDGGSVMTEFIHRCDLVMNITTDISHRVPRGVMDAFEYQRDRWMAAQKSPKVTPKRTIKKKTKSPLPSSQT